MRSERGGLPAPFTGYTATVLPAWIDENGHMNLAYYVWRRIANASTWRMNYAVVNRSSRNRSLCCCTWT